MTEEKTLRLLHLRIKLLTNALDALSAGALSCVPVMSAHGLPQSAAALEQLVATAQSMKELPNDRD